eukprot:6196778-Pleurochrysis_carterae.AAC.3
MVRSQVNTHGSECDCLNPQDVSQGNNERCHRRPACAIPRGACRLVPRFRSQVGDGNIQLRLVRVRPAGRRPRSPTGAWTALVGPPERRGCVMTLPASWHRKFVHNRRRGFVHIPTYKRSAVRHGSAVNQLPASVRSNRRGRRAGLVCAFWDRPDTSWQGARSRCCTLIRSVGRHCVRRGAQRGADSGEDMRRGHVESVLGVPVRRARLIQRRLAARCRQP